MTDAMFGKRSVGMKEFGSNNGQQPSDGGFNKPSKGKTGLKIKIKFNGALITGASITGPKGVNPPASPLLDLGDLEGTVRGIVAEVFSQGDGSVPGGLLSPLPSQWNQLFKEGCKVTEQSNGKYIAKCSTDRTVSHLSNEEGALPTHETACTSVAKDKPTCISAELPEPVATAKISPVLPAQVQKRSIDVVEDRVDNELSAKRHKQDKLISEQNAPGFATGSQQLSHATLPITAEGAPCEVKDLEKLPASSISCNEHKTDIKSSSPTEGGALPALPLSDKPTPASLSFEDEPSRFGPSERGMQPACSPIHPGTSFQKAGNNSSSGKLTDSTHKHSNTRGKQVVFDLASKNEGPTTGPPNSYPSNQCLPSGPLQQQPESVSIPRLLPESGETLPRLLPESGETLPLNNVVDKETHKASIRMEDKQASQHTSCATTNGPDVCKEHNLRPVEDSIADTKAVMSHKQPSSTNDKGLAETVHLARQETLEEGEALPTPGKVPQTHNSTITRQPSRGLDSNHDRSKSKQHHADTEPDTGQSRKELYREGSRDVGRDADRYRRNDVRDRQQQNSHRNRYNERDRYGEHARDRSRDRDRSKEHDRYEKERDRRRDRDRDYERRDRDRGDNERRDRFRRDRRDGDSGSRPPRDDDGRKGRSSERASPREELHEFKRPRLGSKADDRKDTTADKGFKEKRPADGDAKGMEKTVDPVPIIRTDSVPMEIDTPDGQTPPMVPSSVIIGDTHEDRTVVETKQSLPAETSGAARPGVDKGAQTDAAAGPSGEGGPESWCSSYFRWSHQLSTNAGNLNDSTESLMAEGKKFKRYAELAKERANGKYNAAAMMFMFNSFLKFLQAGLTMEQSGKHPRTSVSTLYQQTAQMIEHCVEPNRTAVKPEAVQEAVHLLSRRLAGIARLRSLNLDRNAHKQEHIAVTTSLAKQKGYGETFHRPSPGDSNISSNTSAAAQGSQASGGDPKNAGNVEMSKDAVDSSLRCLSHMQVMMKVLDNFQRTSVQLQKFALKAEQMQLEPARQTAAYIAALGMDAACGNMPFLINLGKQAVDTLMNFAKEAETGNKEAAEAGRSKKAVS